MITLLVSGHWLNNKIGAQERCRMSPAQIVKMWPNLSEYVDSIVTASYGCEYDDEIEFVRDDTLPLGCCYCYDDSRSDCRWAQ